MRSSATPEVLSMDTFNGFMGAPFAVAPPGYKAHPLLGATGAVRASALRAAVATAADGDGGVGRRLAPRPDVGDAEAGGGGDLDDAQCTRALITNITSTRALPHLERAMNHMVIENETARFAAQRETALIHKRLIPERVQYNVLTRQEQHEGALRQVVLQRDTLRQVLQERETAHSLAMQQAQEQHHRDMHGLRRLVRRLERDMAEAAAWEGVESSELRRDVLPQVQRRMEEEAAAAAARLSEQEEAATRSHSLAGTGSDVSPCDDGASWVDPSVNPATVGSPSPTSPRPSSTAPAEIAAAPSHGDGDRSHRESTVGGRRTPSEAVRSQRPSTLVYPVSPIADGGGGDESRRSGNPRHGSAWDERAATTPSGSHRAATSTVVSRRVSNSHHQHLTTCTMSPQFLEELWHSPNGDPLQGGELEPPPAGPRLTTMDKRILTALRVLPPEDSESDGDSHASGTSASASPSTLAAGDGNGARHSKSAGSPPGVVLTKETVQRKMEEMHELTQRLRERYEGEVAALQAAHSAAGDSLRATLMEKMVEIQEGVAYVAEHNSHTKPSRQENTKSRAAGCRGSRVDHPTYGHGAVATATTTKPPSWRHRASIGGALSEHREATKAMNAMFDSETQLLMEAEKCIRGELRELRAQVRNDRLRERSRQLRSPRLVPLASRSTSPARSSMRSSRTAALHASLQQLTPPKNHEKMSSARAHFTDLLLSKGGSGGGGTESHADADLSTMSRSPEAALSTSNCLSRPADGRGRRQRREVLSLLMSSSGGKHNFSDEAALKRLFKYGRQVDAAMHAESGPRSLPAAAPPTRLFSTGSTSRVVTERDAAVGAGDTISPSRSAAKTADGSESRGSVVPPSSTASSAALQQSQPAVPSSGIVPQSFLRKLAVLAPTFFGGGDASDGDGRAGAEASDLEIPHALAFSLSTARLLTTLTGSVSAGWKYSRLNAVTGGSGTVGSCIGGGTDIPRLEALRRLWDVQASDYEQLSRQVQVASTRAERLRHVVKTMRTNVETTLVEGLVRQREAKRQLERQLREFLSQQATDRAMRGGVAAAEVASPPPLAVTAVSMRRGRGECMSYRSNGCPLKGLKSINGLLERQVTCVETQQLRLAACEDAIATLEGGEHQRLQRDVDSLHHASVQHDRLVRWLKEVYWRLPPRHPGGTELDGGIDGRSPRSDDYNEWAMASLRSCDSSDATAEMVAITDQGRGAGPRIPTASPAGNSRSDLPGDGWRRCNVATPGGTSSECPGSVGRSGASYVDEPPQHPPSQLHQYHHDEASEMDDAEDEAGCIPELGLLTGREVDWFLRYVVSTM